MKLVFILGLLNDSNKLQRENKLLREQNVHGDLLQINVMESWNLLVLKSLRFLEWAAFRVNSSFIFKADVDSFLNISSILQGLESIGNPDELSSISASYGSLVKEVLSYGWGYWRMPATICCKKDIFPDYHSGGALEVDKFVLVYSYYLRDCASEGFG